MKIDELSPTTTNSNRMSYNGKEIDKDLNCYHYGARFYDPAVGRWWNVDGHQQYYSFYTYVNNNPIYYVDRDGNDGFGFLLEIDFFGKTVNFGIIVEVGSMDKLEIGLLYNEGYALVDGLTVGASLNALVTVGSKNLKGWSGRSYEVDVNSGIHSGSLSISKDLNIIQASYGQGLGLGTNVIQGNNSNVVGVSISNILENTETAIRENIEDMLYITNPLRYRDYVYKDNFINSFDDKVIYKSYGIFHDDESVTVIGYNEVID